MIIISDLEKVHYTVIACLNTWRETERVVAQRYLDRRCRYSPDRGKDVEEEGRSPTLRLGW